MLLHWFLLPGRVRERGSSHKVCSPVRVRSYIDSGMVLTYIRFVPPKMLFNVCTERSCLRNICPKIKSAIFVIGIAMQTRQGVCKFFFTSTCRENTVLNSLAVGFSQHRVRLRGGVAEPYGVFVFENNIGLSHSADTRNYG